MIKNYNTYFTILTLIMLAFTIPANAKYIVDNKIPLIFKGTLKSVDTSSTALFEVEGRRNYLNLMRKAGLKNTHYVILDDTKFLIRLAIAGASDIYITNEDKINIGTNISSEEYQLTCYSVDFFQKKGRLPLCYIEKLSDSMPLLEEINAVLPKYLPLDYKSIQDTPELVIFVEKIEKKLIISDFLL